MTHIQPATPYSSHEPSANWLSSQTADHQHLGQERGDNKGRWLTPGPAPCCHGGQPEAGQVVRRLSLGSLEKWASTGVFLVSPNGTPSNDGSVR